MASPYSGPNTDLLPNADDMKAFIRWWFGACRAGKIEIGWLDPKGYGLIHFVQFDPDDIDALAVTAYQENLVPGQSMYVRASTVRERHTFSKTAGYTTDADFVFSPGIWLDIDTPEQYEQAKTVQSMVRPSAVVTTGTIPHKRVQLWFQASSSLGEPNMVTDLNRRLHSLYGGDPAVVNPTRLMRLPGTIAWPWKKSRTEVEVTRFQLRQPGGGSSPTYNIAMLYSQLPKTSEARPEPNASKPASDFAVLMGLNDKSTLGSSTSETISRIRSGNGWHNDVLRFAARWVNKGLSDAEIQLFAPGLTLPGYSIKQTQEELQSFVDSARKKWGKENGDAFGDERDWKDEFGPNSAESNPEEAETLKAITSIDSWIARDIPEPDRILGDFLTTTVRAFLVGRTGLGKTLIGLALAAAAAAGVDFLHWRGYRPMRVLYIDGEMPAELIKPRAIDAVRRLKGAKIPPGNLLIFGRDIEAEAREKIPSLPPFDPLNTDDGKKFLTAFIKIIGGVDLIVFDNVMSLLEGDQKDELSWSSILDLVTHLTTMRIGQLWLDHTGHNNDRQYGSSTKAWRFDAVGVMSPLKDEDGGQEEGSTAFTLSFDHPGKARRKTPDNWKQFQPQIVRLEHDEWTTEPLVKPKDDLKLKPTFQMYYEALIDALSLPGQRPNETTFDFWYGECVRKEILDPILQTDTGIERDKKKKQLMNCQRKLQEMRVIGVNNGVITHLRGNKNVS